MKKRLLKSKVLLMVISILMVLNFNAISFASNDGNIINIESVYQKDLEQSKSQLLDDFKENKLDKNIYFQEVKNELKVLKQSYITELNLLFKDDMNDKNSFLLNLDLNLEDFKVKDQEYIKSLKETNPDYKSLLRIESFFLRKAIDITSSYYLQTDSGVKIYPSFINKQANIFKIAYDVRRDILDDVFVGNDYNTFSIWRETDLTDNIEFKLSENNKLANFVLTLYLFNNMPIDKSLTENINIYLSPYMLEDINGYAIKYSGNLISKNDSILVGQKIYGNTLSIDNISIILKLILHELGHIIEVRADLVKNDINLKERYFNYNFDKDMNIMNEILQYDDAYIEWSHLPSENFAEDFAVFMNKVLFNEEYKMPKKTPYVYDKNIEDLFNKIL